MHSNEATLFGGEISRPASLKMIPLPYTHDDGFRKELRRATQKSLQQSSEKAHSPFPPPPAASTSSPQYRHVANNVQGSQLLPCALPSKQLHAGSAEPGPPASRGAVRRAEISDPEPPETRRPGNPAVPVVCRSRSPDGWDTNSNRGHEVPERSEFPQNQDCREYPAGAVDSPQARGDPRRAAEPGPLDAGAPPAAAAPSSSCIPASAR